MQPIEMGEHIPGLWLSGRLSKPGEHDRAQIFLRQQHGIQFSAAVLVERLGQPLIESSFGRSWFRIATRVDLGG